LSRYKSKEWLRMDCGAAVTNISASLVKFKFSSFESRNRTKKIKKRGEVSIFLFILYLGLLDAKGYSP
jgi:hypothetical protein